MHANKYNSINKRYKEMKQLTALQEKYAQVYSRWINESDPVRKLQLELQLKSIWEEQRKAESRLYPSIIKDKATAKATAKAAAKALRTARKNKELERIDIYDICDDLI